MFDCLADQMKHDQHIEESARERMARWFAVAVLSVIVFGGLYFAVQVLQ